jgi:hypothetical protein
MNNYIAIFVLGFMELTMAMPLCQGGESEKATGGTSKVNLNNCSVKGWKDAKEMEADVRSYKTRPDGLSLKYAAYIKERIEATANVGVANRNQIIPRERDQIDNALCILWECRDSLDTIESILYATIYGVNNRKYTLEEKADQGDPIVLALQKAQITPVEGQKNMNNLMDTIGSEAGKLAQTLYGNNDEDFTDLAIFVAFLHDNLKQWNLSYDFASVLDSILELYESTKNKEIKKLIAIELKKIPCGSKTIGPYGDEIKEFSRSLRRILGL